jgi:hypothetical protein
MPLLGGPSNHSNDPTPPSQPAMPLAGTNQGTAGPGTYGYQKPDERAPGNPGQSDVVHDPNGGSRPNPNANGGRFGTGPSGSEYFTQNYTDDRTPAYGGYRGGANDAANHFGAMGDAWASAQAPTADLTNANQARGYGSSALGLDLAAAQGNAPSAAEQQFGRNLGQSINAQAAMANSTRGGGSNLAAAQRAGAMQSAGMQAQGAQDAAQLRAQEMATARAQLGQQALGQQGTDTQTALGLTGQQLQQEQINQHGQLGMYGLANQAQLGQLQSDTAGYTGNLDKSLGEDKLSASNMWNQFATAGEVVGGVMMAADVHLKEPDVGPGGAHWSLREEPTFLLARNERTGELRKLATEPLSPHERRQAEAPHGAGPLGSMAHPLTKVVGDLSMGGLGSILGQAGANAQPQGEGRNPNTQAFTNAITANTPRLSADHDALIAADLHLQEPGDHGRTHPSEGTKSGQRAGAPTQGLLLRPAPQAGPATASADPSFVNRFGAVLAGRPMPQAQGQAPLATMGTPGAPPSFANRFGQALRGGFG